MEQALNELKELIVIDEESMTLIDTESGEIKGYAPTPPEDADDVKLAEWIGEHVQKHGARLAELEAGKQWQIDRINALYDSRIKRERYAIDYLKTHWYDRLYQLAKSLIGDGKKRSVVCGLLKLSLSKSREKVEVVDMDKAVQWCAWSGTAMDAIKTVRTVLVSKLDVNALATIDHSDSATTGMVYHPAGEREDLKVE